MAQECMFIVPGDNFLLLTRPYDNIRQEAYGASVPGLRIVYNERKFENGVLFLESHDYWSCYKDHSIMRVDSIIKFRKDDGLDIHATQGPVIWPDDGSNLLFGAKYEAKRCNLKYLCPNIHVANQLSQDLQHFDQLFED